MSDSEDKARPQEHEEIPDAPQKQPLPEVASATQNHTESDKQTTPYSQKKSKPPRRNWVESLIAAGVTSQEIWNAAVAVFTGLLLVITYWQYQLGQEQNQLGRDSFRFTQMNERPWVSAEISLPYPLTFDEKGNLGIEIELAVKNVGRTVAQEAWNWTELTFLDPDGGDIAARKRQAEVCDAYRSPVGPSRNRHGFALFPEVGSQEFIVKEGKWAKEIAQELARALPVNKGKVGFAIIGCVSYRAASEDTSDQRHQTRFLYHIGLWDDDTQTSTVFVKPRGGPYNIVLIPRVSGSSAD